MAAGYVPLTVERSIDHVVVPLCVSVPMSPFVIGAVIVSYDDVNIDVGLNEIVPVDVVPAGIVPAGIPAPPVDENADWRPADIPVAEAPGHPCRRPDPTGHPQPAILRVIYPPPIVEGGPTPGEVRRPGPAVFVVPHPSALRIGSPAMPHATRLPDTTVGRQVIPASIGRQIVMEIGSVRIRVRIGRLCLGRRGTNGEAHQKGH